MLFIQAMLNKSNIVGLADSKVSLFTPVKPTKHESAVRTVLGLNTDTTGENTDEHKTTIITLLRCARAIAHKCDGRITASLASLNNSNLKKDKAYIAHPAVITAGRLEWLAVPGSGSLPVVRQIKLVRDGVDNANFNIHAINTNTTLRTTYAGKLVAEELRIQTPQGVIVLKGGGILGVDAQEVFIANTYPYPHEELTHVLRTSVDAQVVIQGSGMGGIAGESDVDYLGVLAIGLAARGVYANTGN